MNNAGIHLDAGNPPQNRKDGERCDLSARSAAPLQMPEPSGLPGNLQCRSRAGEMVRCNAAGLLPRGLAGIPIALEMRDRKDLLFSKEKHHGVVLVFSIFCSWAGRV